MRFLPFLCNGLNFHSEITRTFVSTTVFFSSLCNKRQPALIQFKVMIHKYYTTQTAENNIPPVIGN